MHADGTPVVFATYSDAAPYLRERLGRFCSYCERKIPVNLAVEHVVPKSQNPALEKDWGNFLLACTNCNSHKRDKPVEPADYLWPDTDDTLAAFAYEPSGAIKVAASLDSQQQVKAQALLSLVGLDKPPAETTAADYRHKDRLEQWGKARIALDMLVRAPDRTRDKPAPLLSPWPPMAIRFGPRCFATIPPCYGRCSRSIRAPESVESMGTRPFNSA